MRRLLLTSSQVSLVLSCIITLAFTLLLFLSGLFLQRRTIHSLRAHLAPNLPPIPASHYIAPSPPSSSSRHFSPDYATTLSARDYASQQRTIDWSRLAHVQIPTSHHAVCSAVMLFADLHRLKSPAKRILVFPAEWLGGEGNRGTTGQGGMGKVRADVSDPWAATTRRLLRVAGRRYGVQLRPVGGEQLRGKGRKGWFGLGQEVVDEGKELEARKLEVLLGMGDLERALVVRTPGWVLDASGLDGALAYADVEGVATLTAGGNGTDAVLVKTGEEGAVVLHKSQSKSAEVDGGEKRIPAVIEAKELELLAQAGMNITELPSTGEDVRLLGSIGELHSPPASETFNATGFLSSASYITFVDPKLPAGPEYDVPFADKVRARPENKDADWVWTKLYGSFAERRREVCGLDLEWYPPS
ncbi:Glucose N-acetyltransferase-like protein 3 [Elsinoe fawcettii]|nr:Glucose N-acetyltransferase-like protein 3 [Elsinoe fawcettii]